MYRGSLVTFSIVLTFLLVMVSPNAIQAKIWKPYDDFEKGFSSSDAKPGDAKLPFGKNWIRFIPQDGLKMDVKDGMLLFDVTATGTRDPGFKLALAGNREILQEYSLLSKWRNSLTLVDDLAFYVLTRSQTGYRITGYSGCRQIINIPGVQRRFSVPALLEN